MEKTLRLSLKGTLRFFIVFGLTLWLWSFFRSYLLFLALILMLVSVLGSAGLLWCSRNLLRAEAFLPGSRVGRGARVPFDIRVENDAKFVGFTAEIVYSWCNVFTGYTERQKVRLWVAPGTGGELRQLLESQYAGMVEAKIEEFFVYDLFHIVYLRGGDRSDGNVLVWPDFTEESGEEIYSCVEGFPKENETRKRGTDYNPDYEIREYIPGDELKSIHWKLTAKQNKMMVRERLATGREKINVVLPLGNDKSRNDGLMEALYGVCRILLDKDYPIQLYWSGQGYTLRSRYLAEQGELEYAISEILSSSGQHQPGSAQEQMAIEHSGENYILIQTGAYKGAYIQ